MAQKFDGSKCRSYPGRPRIDAEAETLIVRMAREKISAGDITESPAHLPTSVL